MIGTGIANSRRNFILDLIPGANFPFSLRRLSKNTIGGVVEIRNGSTNALTVINLGFDEVEDNAITTALSGANGYVKRFIDHSTNINLSQGTNANQALISKAINGKYAVTFNGTSNTYDTNAGIIEPSLYFTFCSVLTVPAGNGTLVQYSTNTGAIDRRIGVYFSAGKIAIRFYDAANGGYFYDKLSVNPYSGNIVVTVVNNNKTVTVQVNGVTIDMTTGITAPVSSPVSMFFGADRGFTQFLAVTVAEVISFGRALTSAEINDYTVDAKAFYGIS